MKPKLKAMWIDGEEEDTDLDVDNQIQRDVKPTVSARSALNDTPAQARLREELADSGLSICFQSRRDGNSGLYTVNADGSKAANITRTSNIDEIYPHVSKDGKRVCFTTVRVEGLRNGLEVPRFDIYWMSLDRRTSTLVSTDAIDPCWNPKGDRIAFVRRLNPKKTKDYHNYGLFVYDLKTMNIEEIMDRRLLYHAYVPCWSPAGDLMVATIHHHEEFHHAIIVIDLRNKRFCSLESSGINGCRPDLSWNGKFICWNPNDIQIGIAEFRPETNRKLETRAVARAPAPHGSVYFADWSPDGKYIAYSMTPNSLTCNSKTGGLWDVFVTRTKGGPYVQITFDHANNKHPEFFFRA
jgi:Tol biopolymer transport system component